MKKLGVLEIPYQDQERNDLFQLPFFPVRITSSVHTEKINLPEC